jgi:hypothetical protein
MAWTDTIATAVTGDIAPAAMWNAVRDNFALVGPHLIAKKPADEGPISSTTFQADNDLIAPVGANETWLFIYYTRWVQVIGANGPKMRWTFPASAVSATLQYAGRNTAGTFVDFGAHTDTSPFDPGQGWYGPTNNAYGYLAAPITIMFVNGANAGNFALEWAPSGSANLTHKANSTLWGVKLA